MSLSDQQLRQLAHMHRWDRAGLERPIPADELLQRTYERPGTLLEPVLSTGCLALVHGPRGLGKSFFALSIAWAVAAGESFLAWRAPEARPVLYVDGEMTAADVQARTRLLPSAPGNLQFLIAHIAERALGDLAERAGQETLRGIVMMSERRPVLIVLDNLASLANLGSDNVDRWAGLQRFLIQLRGVGFTVLIVHHSNKQGEQRGTSRREDALDLVLGLRLPADYQPSQGARFEIHFEKARGLLGETVAPIEAHMTSETRADGTSTLAWSWRAADESEFARAVALLRAGLSASQMATELGIGRTKGYVLRQRALERGLIAES